MSSIAKPSSTIVPFRTVAAISSSANKTASALTQHDGHGGPISVTGKPKREVLLPSQEVKKGAMQYALYVYRPSAINYTSIAKNDF
jgi:NADH dehydrogenase (ubiquinone) Fe-S protein 7